MDTKFLPNAVSHVEFATLRLLQSKDKKMIDDENFFIPPPSVITPRIKIEDNEYLKH